MARYVKDFFIKENPVDLLQTIDEYLTEQGYTIVDYKGQQVYQKRSGALTAPSFMRISHKDSTLRFQVWIKFPVLPGVFVGEYDLQGIVGKDIKGRKYTGYCASSVAGSYGDYRIGLLY